MFPLGMPDEFGHVGTYDEAGVHVFRSGNRLVPIDRLYT